MGLQGLGMRGAAKLQSQAVSKLGAGAKINQLGNTAFMKFVGARGVEAGASVAVGAVASEYEEDNLLVSLKQRTGLRHGILSLIIGLRLTGDST